MIVDIFMRSIRKQVENMWSSDIGRMLQIHLSCAKTNSEDCKKWAKNSDQIL